MTPEQGMWMQIECYRRMTPQERLQISFRLYQLTRTLARQGVKYQNPDWSDEQVAHEVARRFRLGAGIPERHHRAPGEDRTDVCDQRVDRE